MTKYFLICASRDHVLKGVKGGFAQAGHGRRDYISKPSKGDWVVFYSSKDIFEDGKPLQKFTAIGEIIDDNVYQPDTSSSFKPFRRDVEFRDCHEADIRPLLEELSFIKNIKKWGVYLMNGFREISKDDFEVIKNAMRDK